MTASDDRTSRLKLISAREILGEWQYRYRRASDEAEWNITIARRVRPSTAADRSQVAFSFEVSSVRSSYRSEEDHHYRATREEALQMALDAIDHLDR